MQSTYGEYRKFSLCSTLEKRKVFKLLHYLSHHRLFKDRFLPLLDGPWDQIQPTSIGFPSLQGHRLNKF